MFVLAACKDDINEWDSFDSSCTNEMKLARFLSWMEDFGECGEFSFIIADTVEECNHDIDEYCNDNDCIDQASNFVMFKVEEIPA